MPKDACMFLDAARNSRMDTPDRRWAIDDGSAVDAARIRAAIGDPVRRDDPCAVDLRRFGFSGNGRGEVMPKVYAGFNVCGHVTPGKIWRSLHPVVGPDRASCEGLDRRAATQFSLIASACYGRSGPVECWVEDLAMRDMVIGLRVPGARRVFAVARCADEAGEKLAGQSTAHFEAAFENARNACEFDRRRVEIAQRDHDACDERRSRLALRDMLSYGVEDDQPGSSGRTRAPRVVIAAPPVGPLGHFFRDDERIVLLTLAQHGPMSSSKLFRAVADFLPEARGSAAIGAQLMGFMRARLVMQVSEPTPPRRFRWTLTPRGRRAALFL